MLEQSQKTKGQFRIESQDWEAIQYVAKKKGLSASSYIRMVMLENLRNYFKSQEESNG